MSRDIITKRDVEAALQRPKLARAIIEKCKQVLIELGPPKQFNQPCFCRTIAGTYCVGQPQCKSARKLLAMCEGYLEKDEI